jgi:micrococcal nuclease
MAGLLMLVGTLGLIAGVLSLVKPITRLGIADRKQALLVTIGALVVGVTGSAIAGPQPDVDVASLTDLTATTQATTTSAPSTTQATTTSTTTTSTTAVPTTTTQPPVEVAALVVAITDGDTIRVRLPDGTEEPVRLIGIDAPEPGAPGAAEASSLLRQLIEGEEVTLTLDVSDRDRFDRLLRYVWLGDRLINEELVAAGVATAHRYPPDTLYAEQFEAAEEQAQLLAIGLWTTTTTSTTTTSTTSTTVLAFVSPTTTSAPAPECHPSYFGECVPVGVSDVDCRGGSGDGPFYVGRVTVVGPDVYGLDRDKDGIGCENS